MKKLLNNLSTTHIIMFSFLATILIGAVLLCLPQSSASGNPTPFIDALFTATTSTCVTGLVVVPTVSHWSVFGQIVILCLIQIGGLGVITVISSIAFYLHRKMHLSDSLLLQDAFNLNSLSGLKAFVKKVIAGSAIIEGVGALLYMTVFIPQFGPKGIWISLFNSVSAFCNAGIDIIAENSLCDYVTNPIINIVTCLLVVLGGLGYIVWWDVIMVLREYKTKRFRRLTLHSKIVLCATAILIFVGAALIFIFEYSNPLTIKDFSLFDKIQASFFQSVTTRTAGFATLPQENLTNATSFVSLLLMFIGGSPVGTAGGIKTVTVAVLFATALAMVKNKDEISLFDRTLSKQSINKAVSVTVISFSIVFASTVLLCSVTHASFLNILYETVSATATVGLSKNITPILNDAGKLIITAAMYLGRVGPISLAIAFNVKKTNRNLMKNPIEEISVG